MKKILHLAHYYAPHSGGVETHLQAVNQRLVEKDYTVTVICFQSHPEEKLIEKIENVKVYRIPVGTLVPSYLQNNPFGKLLLKLKVWTWIAQHSKLFLDADVVHVHDVMWMIWPLYMAIYYKLYITFHGWEGRYPVRQRDKLHRLFNSWGAKKSLHVGDFIRQFYLDTPTYVTYGGVTMPSDVGKTSQTKDVLSDKAKIVFVGRLEQENEIAKYIELFQLIKQTYPDVTITFVGDGKYRSACKKIGTVTGFVDKPTQYLKDAELVCANSYLSILEAQSYGKLVISFYSHPLKQSYLETFLGAKYMVIGSSSETVLRKIEKLTLVDQSKLQKKIQDFTQSMSWEKVVEIYEKMWGYKN